jgi:hypothetical protein
LKQVYSAATIPVDQLEMHSPFLHPPEPIQWPWRANLSTGLLFVAVAGSLDALRQGEDGTPAES